MKHSRFWWRSAVVVALMAAVLSCGAAARGKGTLLVLVRAWQEWEAKKGWPGLAALFREKRYAELLARLARLRSSSPGVFFWHNLDYLQGAALSRAGRYAEAADVLVGVWERGSQLGAYALADAVRLYAKVGQWEKASEQAKRLRSASGQEPLYRKAVGRLALSLYNASRYDEALGYFEELGGSCATESGGYYAYMVARCLEQMGQARRACQIYRELVLRADPDDYSARALSRLEVLGKQGCAGLEAGPEFSLSAGKVCLWNNDYKKARGYFVKATVKGSPLQVAKEARKQIAVCLFKERQYERAKRYLRRLLRRFKEPADLAWVNMRLGHCFSRLGRTSLAVRSYRAASRYAPEPEMASRAAYLVGRELQSAGRLKEAERAFRLVVNKYGKTSYAGRARWHLALVSLADGRVEAARAMLTQIIDSGDDSPFYDDACFWLGRVFESSDDYSAAVDRYAQNYAESPNSYFGMVSLERLERLRAGGHLAAGLLDRLASDALACAVRVLSEDQKKYLVLLRKAEALSSPGSAKRQKARAMRSAFLEAFERTCRLFDAKAEWSELVARPADDGSPAAAARLFLSIGLEEKAAGLLRSVALAEPDNFGVLYGAIATYERIGRRDRTVHLAERAFKCFADLRLAVQDVPRWLGEAMYPKEFADVVEPQSASRNVDPELVYAMIREESRFQVSSLSSAAARGVMQLIVPTARKVARDMGLANLPLDRLYEPQTNIALGVEYLRQLLDRFANRTIFAIASYNGGPTNVQRWLKEFEADPADEEFINAIKFSETRRYTQKVLASYRIYKSLYRGKQRVARAASG